MTMLDLLEEEHVRDLLIVEHTPVALKVVEFTGAASSDAVPNAAKTVAEEAMEEASLVRLTNSFLLIAGKVTDR